MDAEKFFGVVEALLFLSGDPVSLEKISEITEVDKNIANEYMNKMIEAYESNLRGIMIRKLENSYQMLTKTMYYDYIVKHRTQRQKQNLSQAAYEALAIIAYNQPVTKVIVEKIRGVNCDSAVIKLMERGLIAEAGRLEAPGRPILYETTDEFLRCFGIKSIKELPPFEELK